MASISRRRTNETLVNIGKQVGYAARDIEGAYSDIVQYPGYTPVHARKRLREVSSKLNEQRRKLNKLIREGKFAYPFGRVRKVGVPK